MRISIPRKPAGAWAGGQLTRSGKLAYLRLRVIVAAAGQQAGLAAENVGILPLKVMTRSEQGRLNDGIKAKLFGLSFSPGEVQGSFLGECR
jgi:hypothetical protein